MGNFTHKKTALLWTFLKRFFTFLTKYLEFCFISSEFMSNCNGLFTYKCFLCTEFFFLFSSLFGFSLRDIFHMLLFAELSLHIEQTFTFRCSGYSHFTVLDSVMTNWWSDWTSNFHLHWRCFSDFWTDSRQWMLLFQLLNWWTFKFSLTYSNSWLPWPQKLASTFAN